MLECLTCGELIMKFIRTVLVLVFVTIGYGAFGENDSIKRKNQLDTNYILDFSNKLSLSLVVEAKQSVLSILAPSGKIVYYKTNQPLPNYGVMLSHKWLNFSVSFPIPGISFTSPEKGSTKSLFLGLGYTGRKLYMRNFFEKHQGYYISNPDVLYPSIQINSDSIYLLPNLKTTTYYGNIYYGFNGNKYSHRGFIVQNELQKKNAGTFLVGGTVVYQWISAKNFLFYSPELGEQIQAVQNYTFGANAGYAYTYVPSKHINISAMLVPGISYLSGRYNHNDVNRKKFNSGWALTGEGRVQVYYSRNNYYAGLGVTSYLAAAWLSKETPVGSIHSYLKLNLGYRFKMKPIKFLKPIGLSN